MRDNLWLQKRFENVWISHFPDIEKENNIIVSFGRNARTRLGSIKSLNKTDTKITITGYFRDERVPEFMIDATLAHEISHYVHGFFSPRPRISKHPHRGGLVDNELRNRGFSEILINQKLWLKTEWKNIIGIRPRKRRSRARSNSLLMLIKELL